MHIGKIDPPSLQRYAAYRNIGKNSCRSRLICRLDLLLFPFFYLFLLFFCRRLILRRSLPGKYLLEIGRPVFIDNDPGIEIGERYIIDGQGNGIVSGIDGAERERLPFEKVAGGFQVNG